MELPMLDPEYTMAANWAGVTGLWNFEGSSATYLGP
jgi:hypothetical protein